MITGDNKSITDEPEVDIEVIKPLQIPLDDDRYKAIKLATKLTKETGEE